MRYVYAFDEDAGGGRELLGGKGVGLAEMTALGVPVPAGFTITTNACRAAMAANGAVPAGLDEEVDEHIARLEQRAGMRFGDPERPLLVSVRSGAAISMPGMMDTILNLGLGDVAVEGLARSTGNRRFAFDSYRRLVQMYGEVVSEVEPHLFEDALTELKRERGVALDTGLSADDLERLTATFKEIYEREVGSPFPQDARDQLRRAYRGRRRGPRSTVAPTRSRTRSGPRATSSRWCSGTADRARGQGSASPVTRRPASTRCSGSSSSTPRVRTWSREPGPRSRSRG